MNAVLAIAAVELRRFMRDRSNIFFVLILPLLLVVVIGLQVNDGNVAGRVAIAGAPSDLRESVVDELEARSMRVDITDADNVGKLVARGRADVGVFIPAAAATAFSAGDAVSLEMIGGSATGAPSIARRVETAVNAVAVERAQFVALVDAGAAEAAVRSTLDAARRSVEAPRLELVDVNAISIEFEGVTGLDLGATGQTLLFVFLSSLSGSVTLLQARRSGVLRRSLAAPVTPTMGIVGQGLGRFAIALFQGGYIMVAARLLFGVNWGDPVASVLVLVAFCAVAAGSAMLIGSLFDNEGTASGVGVGAGLVVAALGGCMVPLEFFPDTLRAVAHITPHAWAYDAFAEIQRRSGGVGDVLTELAVLIAMALVVLLAGSVALRRSLARSL